MDLNRWEKGRDKGIFQNRKPVHVFPSVKEYLLEEGLCYVVRVPLEKEKPFYVFKTEKVARQEIRSL